MEKVIDFLEFIKKRKTTYEFDKRQIPEELLLRILEAGQWAPSCFNVQPWNFIVVKNKEKISEIVKKAYYGVFHNEPPILIVLLLKKDLSCGDHRSVKNNKMGFIEGNISMGMVAMNMLLEAEGLGIQSCILTIEQNEISDILKTPPEDFISLVIGFGYEKEGTYQKKRERKLLKEIVSFETYGNNDS